MFNALEDMAEQLLAAQAIDHYEIHIDYDHPKVKAPDTDTAYSNFGNYLGGHSPPRGAHVLVADTVNDGYADDGTPNEESSFNTWNKAVMGTNREIKQWWKNGMIQETLHTFISTEAAEVYTLGEHGPDSNNQNTEHDFGKVYGGLSPASSPMVTAYAGEHSDHGDCHSKNDPLGWTTTLTDCTVSAVDWTAYVLFG